MTFTSVALANIMDATVHFLSCRTPAREHIVDLLESINGMWKLSIDAIPPSTAEFGR